MKVTLYTLKNSESALTELIAFSNRLPIKVSYRLSKLIKEAQTELTQLEQLRKGLVQKYGETVTNENGQQEHQVSKDKLTDFWAEYNELLNEEIELNYEPIELNLSQIDRLEEHVEEKDKIRLSINSIVILETFINFIEA